MFNLSKDYQFDMLSTVLTPYTIRVTLTIGNPLLAVFNNKKHG